MINIQEINPSQVVRAYTGKVGCMCGCKGKYYAAASDDVSAVNPIMVTRILRTIQAAPPEEIEVGHEYIAWDKGGKTWVAYTA